MPLQANDLSDPDVQRQRDPHHKMFGRLSRNLEEQQYPAVTDWIVKLMQPDMKKRMSAPEALAAECLTAAQ